MSLSDWEEGRILTRHETKPKDVGRLLEAVERDLASSATEGVSHDWQLSIAYGAALKLATLALWGSGYRLVQGAGTHHHAIQSLRLTVGLDEGRIRKLDAFRKARNMATYERAGVASAEDVRRIQELAVELKEVVVNWLRANRKDLLP